LDTQSTNHTVNLTGLEPNTEYHFNVQSVDLFGNETLSTDYTFSTTKSPTLVGGILVQNTTWTVANSPYNITTTIQIPAGVTLTIDPGVIINNTTRENMFLLLGKIYAHGTAQAPITINGGGSTIVYCPPPGERIGDFEYCIFKNGHELWDRWGQITLRYSQIIDFPINYSIIHFDGPSGQINIEYNKFINTGGISTYDDHFGTNIRYNLFQGLRSAITNAGGGTPSRPPYKTIVRYNTFLDVKSYALALGTGFPASWSPSMDGTENYWGTQDANIISRLIYDKNDDVRIALSIDFLPVLIEQHPLTPSSN